MSTRDLATKQHPAPVGQPLSMKEMAELLVKHYGLRAGRFDLMIEYQLGTGGVGPDKEGLLPGLMIGIARVGLVPSTQPGALTVDAREVNPPTKSRRRKLASART